jgi:hypothetical protein
VQQAKFCSQCGVEFSTEQDVADLADHLIALAKDSETKPEQLDEIIKAHANCETGEPCEVCEYMSEELFTNPYEELSQNTALSPAQQNEVFRIGSLAQGAEVSLTINFARNNSICDDLKHVVLSAREFIPFHVGDDFDEIMALLCDAAEENPRFSKAEVKRLRSE